jgi:uncharacterized protein (TIGR04141 family)
MRESGIKKERLSIYLVKDAKLADEQIIKTDQAKPAIDLKIASGEATLYAKDPPPPRIPEWVDFLFSNQERPEDYFRGNRSEGAVLMFRQKDAAFALTFGMGYHLLNLDMVERDFGLKVTLNSVNPDKLRSLDKASYEANPLNTRSQSPKDVDIFDLRIDTESDMVYALTGVSEVPAFGEHVTGRDALTIMPEARLDDLPKILDEALARYQQKPPAKFAWIEDVNRVRNPDDLVILEMELDQLLNQDPPPPNVWLGEPEIVDWETQTGYSFDRYARTPRHQTLELDHLLAYMADHGIVPSSQSFRDQTVHVNDANDTSVKKWTAYQCLYAEILDGGKVYILRNGVWHAVSDNFVARVNEALDRLEIDTTKMPIYAHDDEGEYNASCAGSEPGYELFDCDNVFVGGPYDKIEFCDLVRDGRDLIHVKIYRSSATLSHLFAQGRVSAETFLKHADFRVQLNAKSPASFKRADPALRPDPKNYRVVYAIATTKDLPHQLPFFAKVALKGALAELEMLGFGVAINKIEVDATLLKKGKHKAMGKAAAASKRGRPTANRPSAPPPAAASGLHGR